MPRLSLIIPNHNGARTIGLCLEAACKAAEAEGEAEVIVVDDASSDGSLEIIKQYPVRLIGFKEHKGASAARNAGAVLAEGEALFFIDADCVLGPEALAKTRSAYTEHPDRITGGTYTPIPHDSGSFFSFFQSIFINYFETKSLTPDYVATHAMVISKDAFNRLGGFEERFMPILEDVEFSHRARREGVGLRMDKDLLVSHIFNHDLLRNIQNAYRKSKYWTAYSVSAGDLGRDSGTASMELKVTCLFFAQLLFLALSYLITGRVLYLAALVGFYGLDLSLNRKFLSAFLKHGGGWFALRATLYYTLLYPVPVILGGLSGLFLRRS